MDTFKPVLTGKGTSIDSGFVAMFTRRSFSVGGRYAVVALPRGLQDRSSSEAIAVRPGPLRFTGVLFVGMPYAPCSIRFIGH
jgi:hypothetical protein